MSFNATRKCLGVYGTPDRNSPVPTMYSPSSFLPPHMLTLLLWLHRQKRGPSFLTNFLFHIQTGSSPSVPHTKNYIENVSVKLIVNFLQKVHKTFYNQGPRDGFLFLSKSRNLLSLCFLLFDTWSSSISGLLHPLSILPGELLQISTYLLTHPLQDWAKVTWRSPQMPFKIVACLFHYGSTIRISQINFDKSHLGSSKPVSFHVSGRCFILPIRIFF